MDIRHLNHSCMLIDAAGTRVLVDPGNFSVEAIRSFGALTDLDAILITHQHPDHLDPELLRELLTANLGAVVVAEPEAAEIISSLGYSVVSLGSGETTTVKNLTIHAHGGWHAVIHPDIPRVGNTGFVLEADGEPRFGITGDSLEPIEAFEGIDILAFAVVAPWSKMEETIDFLRAVHPVVALPVHDAIVSPFGRPIFLRQANALSPDGTDVREWPADGAVTITVE